MHCAISLNPVWQTTDAKMHSIWNDIAEKLPLQTLDPTKLISKVLNRANLLENEKFSLITMDLITLGGFIEAISLVLITSSG